jgi:hypothetical protein
VKKRSPSAGLAAFALALAFIAALLPAADANFVLKADWKGPCRARPIVDVNLGNTTASFIKACYCQIQGRRPTDSELHAWFARLKAEPNWRRVDVVRTIARRLGKSVALSYSDPWANNPDLPPAGPKSNNRDIGANIVSFFNCPRGVNCGMDWADNHVEGMDAASAALAFKGVPGFYCADNPGFWLHELRDARAAGLDFLVVDVYGPDIRAGRIRTLVRALAESPAGVKIALSDDTWTWGQPWFGPYWRDKPSFDEPERSAAKLYASKWKPFFMEVPRRDWYLVQGRPLIFFYNAGTLQPRNRSSETLEKMKERFKADFGVEPYLVVDQPYFEDPRLRTVADGRYIWDPLDHGDSPDHISWSRWGTKTIAHAMVRWDSVGRDKPGQVAGAGDRLLKGPETLARVLDETRGADILVLATWNDLGEGTGVNRAYDYWYRGRWLPPDVFIEMLRRAH